MLHLASPSDRAIAAIDAGLNAYFSDKAHSEFVGPHDIGSDGYRAWISVQHANALAVACVMMLDGSTPRQVADFVLSLGIVGGSVSRAIENAAYPGTFAEAVFNILAD